MTKFFDEARAMERLRQIATTNDISLGGSSVAGRSFISEISKIEDGIAAGNFILVPSFVDVHVHFREPGFFYKETIETGAAAAARGGYSHVCAMPNLNPVPDSRAHLQVELDAIRKYEFEEDGVTEKPHVHVLPYGSITVGEKGDKLSDLEEIAESVVAFSDDGVGLNDPELMREAMLRAKALGKIIVAHCEDLDLRAGGYIHDGEYAKTHGHKGISSESEWKPIERDLKIAEETGCRYHVCHISTKESVEVIRAAKKRGVKVTCETAPHYLVLNDGDLQEDGRFKMNPPIRSEEDRLALIEGLRDGTIDCIATDHAPHSLEEKSKGLRDSAMGIVGLETAFPVLYTKLVKSGVLELGQLIELMSINPRSVFGIDSGFFEAASEFGAELPGSTEPAPGLQSFALWDVATPYEIDPNEFQSKGRATPFAGWQVYGKCLLNVVDGRVVWKDM